jgi:hypothetical protein
LLDHLVLPFPPLTRLAMPLIGICKLSASTSVSSDNKFDQELALAAIAIHCIQYEHSQTTEKLCDCTQVTKGATEKISSNNRNDHSIKK